MGTGHSTNLDRDTSFEISATGSIARWSDSFEVCMSKENENDHTKTWGAKYKTFLQNHTCSLNLKATSDKYGVERIHFGLLDTANNEIEFAVNISRIDRDNLHAYITGLNSMVSAKFVTSTVPNWLIDTYIVAYSCSYREGLFVLELMKDKIYENACKVNLAHYYVTEDVGLFVTATIYQKYNRFAIEVVGPFKHPSADLRKDIIETRSRGILTTPTICKLRKTKATVVKKNGDSNSMLKGQTLVQHSSSLMSKVKQYIQHSSSLLKGESNVQQQQQQSNGKVVGEDVKHALFSSTVKEQFISGLINSTGYTSGSLNNSIIFVDCKFLNA